MSFTLPEKFVSIRDKYWKNPKIPLRKDDLLWVIGELDREYFLHDHERTMSRRWLKQRDKAENDVEALLDLLRKLHESVRDSAIPEDVDQQVLAVLNARSDRARRLALR